MYGPCQRLVSCNGWASDSMGILSLLQNIHIEYYHSKKTKPLITNNPKDFGLHSLSHISVINRNIIILMRGLKNASYINFIKIMTFPFPSIWHQSHSGVTMMVTKHLAPTWYQDIHLWQSQSHGIVSESKEYLNVMHAVCKIHVKFHVS